MMFFTTSGKYHQSCYYQSNDHPQFTIYYKTIIALILKQYKSGIRTLQSIRLLIHRILLLPLVTLHRMLRQISFHYYILPLSNIRTIRLHHQQLPLTKLRLCHTIVQTVYIVHIVCYLKTLLQTLSHLHRSESCDHYLGLSTPVIMKGVFAWILPSIYSEILTIGVPVDCVRKLIH